MLREARKFAGFVSYPEHSARILKQAGDQPVPQLGRVARVKDREAHPVIPNQPVVSAQPKIPGTSLEHSGDGRLLPGFGSLPDTVSLRR